MGLRTQENYGKVDVGWTSRDVGTDEQMWRGLWQMGVGLYFVEVYEVQSAPTTWLSLSIPTWDCCPRSMGEVQVYLSFHPHP